MNTAVNFVFQFLAKQIFSFSQFLYDDHIKSRLIKELRFFRKERASLSNQYPFTRAEAACRDLRRLGVQDGRESSLELFRQLVSHIGNTMAYVRMVRASGQRCCVEAIESVPDRDNAMEKCSTDVHLSEESRGAASLLYRAVEQTNDSLAADEEYFSRIERVISAELCSPKNSHLEVFYIIVPVLSISFVESMVANRDRLHKRRKEGAFTDDGFAVGLAYLLRLLEQKQSFDALHWFESVRAHFSLERDSLAPDMSGAGRSRGLSPESANSLALKRLERFETEFEMLYYAIDSSLTMFVH